MHRMSLFAFMLFLACLIAAAPVRGQDIPENKQTTLGLYVNAKEAYEMWRQNPEGVFIIDCRTPEEYYFGGHPTMAYNIPCKFMSYKVNGEGNYLMKPNLKFIPTVRERFEKTDTLLVICTSGVRTAESVNRLAKAGFTKVYSIVDGFEGDKVTEEGSYFLGKRMLNGWKNAGNPWGYDMNKELIYSEE